jgi:hypothetical protein
MHRTQAIGNPTRQTGVVNHSPKICYKISVSGPVDASFLDQDDHQTAPSPDNGFTVLGIAYRSV